MLKANAIHLKVNVKTVKPDLTCHDGRFYFLLLTELKRILRSEQGAYRNSLKKEDADENCFDNYNRKHFYLQEPNFVT